MHRTVRKVYLLLFFLVYFKTPVQSERLRCNNNIPDCLCMNLGNSLEIHCPPELDINFNGTVVKITDEQITIDCYYMPTFNTSFLPIYDIKEIKKLKIQSCPLSPTAFTEVLARFNIKKIDDFIFHLSDFSNAASLGKDYFIGFETLKYLSLNSNNMINIDENVFENLPNLEKLDVSRNKIVLKTGMFDFTPKLKWLDISSNSLTSLPEGLFENLTKLEDLYLYSNYITELPENTFRGLENLKVLEMTNNKIETIHENVFKNTPRLVNISFNNNKLKYIAGKLFSANDYLRNIRLAYNSKVKLADFAFANIINLTSVDLFMCEIEELPENLFNGSTNLNVIKLDKNNLKTLSRDLFKGLNKLSELYLNSSKIESISNETLANLKSLQFLYLQENSLNEISSETFRNLVNLEELDLRKNKIEIIKPFLPEGNKLKRLYLSHNYIVFDEENPFHNLHNLELLDLGYNNLEDFSVSSYLRTAQSVKLLDLSYNNFTFLLMDQLMPIFNHKVQINLSNNQITEISYDGCIEFFLRLQKENLDNLNEPGDASLVSVNLSNNPIKCDCYSYNLVKYFHDLIDPRIKTLINLEEDNLLCDGPKELKGRAVPNLRLQELMCPFEEFNVSCSDSCNCFYRPYNDTVIADCSGRNLNELPELSFDKCVNIPGIYCGPTCFNKTSIQEVHLENNVLEIAPTVYDDSYVRVNRLDLTNNHIKNITWVPKNISHLYLGNNLIEKLDYSLLHFLNTSEKLEEMTLDNNPWDCNCSAWNFTLFLRYNYKRVNTNGVNCAANNQPLLEILDEELLCPSNTIPILVSCVIIIGTLLIAATILALYLRFNEEIKIWLFAHNLCLWWVTEEEMDKDKIYDAFVSYSHEDEDFLSENLVPVLESSGYKLCLHERDFIPGLLIHEQIANTVRDSRRTLIILSNNFLKSEWAKYEFQVAHLQALEDRLPRVIIVLYGDIDMELLNEDFRVYLKTNTYVKWGNKWFWDKLKYALPHSNKRRTQRNDRKHANIMMSIDDKYKLKKEKIENEGTTPPLTTLDAASLKKHPLSFKAGEINVSNIENGGLNPLVVE